MIAHANSCKSSDRDVVLSLLREYESWTKRQELRKKRAEKVRHPNRDINDLPVKLIATHALPMSLMSSTELKKFVKARSSKYKLPDRRTLSYRILPDLAN